MAEPAATQTAVLDDREHAMRLFRQMALVRRFEERTEEQYTRARIGGYCHLAIGEEAASVGAIDALQTGDALFASYRDHATALAVGSPAAAVMAELFGKDTGVAHGRGGSMHLLDVERRFFGGWGIVGAHLPIATGAALAFAYRGEPHAVLCQFGDGAMATGAYHEALNLASVWNLPIVFQAINNQYGMGTRVDQSNAEPELAKQGAGYRMHGERVDGNDVLAVREAASRLLAQAREERRPALLETVTYRYRGHSVADAGKVYRTPEEVQSWRERDPITRYGLLLGERGIATRRRPRGGLGGRRRRGEGRDLPGAGRVVPEPRRPLRPPLRRRGVARAVRADVDGCAVRRARRGARMADVTYREALRRALDEELERDPDVFLMGEEIGRFEGSYKVTAGLWEKYGADRVRETPISEEGFIGAGIGAAMMGLRPVVEIMTINFILVAMDQVVNHAAKIRYMFGGTVGVPIVIRTPGGAGAQLTAQHSQSLEGWFAGCPGLKVVAPSNPADAYGMLKTAIRDDDPVLFCENLVLYNVTGTVPENGDFTVPIGPGGGRAGGRRPHHRRPLLHRAAGATGGGPARPGRHLGRGRRPALAAPARRRHRRRVGAKDEPRARGRGGLVDVRRRRRARGAHPAGVLRRPRRAGRAGRRGRGADAVLQAARAGRAAARVQDRGGRALPASGVRAVREAPCPKS